MRQSATVRTAARYKPVYNVDGRILRRLLCMPLVMLPILLGGARPWFWSCIAAVFGVGAAWTIWSRQDAGWTAGVSRRWLLGLSLLLLYPLLQSLPLTASCIDYLSPHLMQWKRTASEVALAPSGYFSISYAPLVSLFSGLWWVFLAGYALLFRKILREESNLDWFYHTLFWVAGLEALYGLLQTLSPSLGVLWESPGQGVARGTFVNRNHYACFLGMVWPVLLSYLLSLTATSTDSQTISHSELEQRKKSGQKKWFLGFIIGLILLGLFFSQSRGGIIGALVSLTVFVLFGKKWRKKGMMGILLGCWLVMLAYGSIIGFQDILVRFDLMEKDAPGRLEIWEDTWRMIQDHWLTGTGLGTFAEVIRVYQSHLMDKFDIVHAHNDYLEIAGELGVPLAATMISLAWAYWWICAAGIVRQTPSRIREKGTTSPGGLESTKRDWADRNASTERTEILEPHEVGRSGNRRHRRQSSTSRLGGGQYGVGDMDQKDLDNRKLLALGALAASAAFLCHSWVDFNWQIPANQLYFIVLLILMKA